MISRCFCESTKIEVSGIPDWVAYCHCEDCRRVTGAPITAYASYKDAYLEYKVGSLDYYESSPGTKWGSCSVCHSPMTYQTNKYPNETHLHLITIDEHAEIFPSFHVHCSEAVRWFATADDWPRYEGNSDNE